jgi:hypothetical protein
MEIKITLTIKEAIADLTKLYETRFADYKTFIILEITEN